MSDSPFCGLLPSWLCTHPLPFPVWCGVWSPHSHGESPQLCPLEVPSPPSTQVGPRCGTGPLGSCLFITIALEEVSRRHRPLTSAMSLPVLVSTVITDGDGSQTQPCAVAVTVLPRLHGDRCPGEDV